MSRLAVNWVESNFTLDRPVVNAEKEFANGYLFLDMLAQKNVFNEDDLDGCRDSDLPKDVLKNMHILSRGLKKLGVTLTKAQVADITSEQPGGATNLIMKLKRTFDGSTNPTYANSGFRKATQSLKPREFVRSTTKQEGFSDEEFFFMNNLANRASHTFRDIDSIIQTDKFYKFDTKQDRLFNEKMTSQLKNYERASVERRQKILDNINERIRKREETFEAGQLNWKKNEQDKIHRKKRDLHFELSLQAISKSKAFENSQRNRIDQESGIEAFEMNLKRNGIGGEVDEGGALLPSSEDSMLFLNRIENNAAKDWPTDGEVGDFMQVLQKRTKELRVARAEKARRKRRMLVDQDVALNNMQSTDNFVADDSIDLSAVNPDEEKFLRKQQDIADRTASAKADHAKIVEEAEERIRIFCEQSRMKAFDNDNQEDKVHEALASQAKRAEDKKRRNYDLCRGLIQQLVNELFSIDPNLDVSSRQNEDKLTREKLIPAVLNLLLQDKQEEKEEHSVMKCIVSSHAADLWISAVNIAKNTGKWMPQTEGCPLELRAISGRFGRTLSFAEKSSQIFSETLSFFNTNAASPFDVDSTEAFKMFIEKQNAAVVEDVPVPLSEGGEDSNESGNEPPISQQVCVVFGEANDISPDVWRTAVNWMGGEHNISHWNIERALLLAFDLYSAALPEGKSEPNDELITFSILSDRFGVSCKEIHEKSSFGKEEGEDKSNRSVEDIEKAVSDITIPFQMANTISSVISTAARILEGKSLIAVEGTDQESSFDVSVLEFNYSTLMILSGQVLWLRDQLSRKVFEATQVTPYTPHVLFFSSNKVSDNGMAIKLFSWFLRGGSRVNVPADDTELADEIKVEMGTEKPKKGKSNAKKKDKKDKSEMVLYDESTIRSIVWVSCAAAVADSEEKEKSQCSEEPKKTEENEVTISNDLNPDGDPDILQVLSLYLDKINQECVSIEDQKEELKALSGIIGCPFRLFLIAKGPIELDASSYFIANDYYAIEYLVSVVAVDLLKQHPDNEDGVDDVIRNYSKKRKKLLSPSQRLWVDMSASESPLKPSDLESILVASRQNMIKTDEILGSMVLIALLKLESVYKNFSLEKAKAIGSLKETDSNWKKICSSFHHDLLKMSSSCANAFSAKIDEEFILKVRDLNCELGDVIDSRHLKWLKLISSQEKVLVDQLNESTATMLDITYSLRELFPSLLEEHLKDALSFSSALAPESEDIPWVLKVSTAPQDSIEQIQQRLLQKIEQLHSHLLPGGQNELNDRFSREMWKEVFLKADESVVNARRGSCGSTALDEVHLECYTSFYCFVSGLCSSIQAVQSAKSTLTNELARFVKDRNRYEHQMLQSWIGELRQTRQNKNADNPLASPIQFISTYFFGVSSDPDLDGVPQTSLLQQGLVDVEDMSVSIGSLRELVVHIVKVRQENEYNALSVFETLKAVAIRAHESGMSLPPSWRATKRLRAMYDAVLRSSNDYSLSENQDAFFQHLVMRLAFGILKCAPSSSYLTKLGAKLLLNAEDPNKSTRLTPTEKTIIDLSKITNAINQDKVLKQGWWGEEDKAIRPEDNSKIATMVVEAVGLMCCTSVTPISFCGSEHDVDTAYVVFDTFVAVMSKNFQSTQSGIVALEENICSAVDWQEIASNKDSFPHFVDEGLTKLCNVASSLVESSPATIPSPLVAMEQKLYGATLTGSKKKWIEKYLNVENLPVGNDDVKIDLMIRKAHEAKINHCI